MQNVTIPVRSLDPLERLPNPGPEADTEPPGQMRIEAVARIAGVSPITVSRALRKPGMVSEPTRIRVEEAVRATGFSLNPHASALRSGRSNVVAAFVSSLASEQFLQAAGTFTDVIEATGFEVVLARTSYSFAREIQLTRSFLQVRPAGVFITGVLEQELVRDMFRRLNVPVVESWANSEAPIDMLVGISNTDGATAATQHLGERGYRKLAFIGRATGRGRIRHQAYLQECARLGLENVGSVLLPTVRSQDDGRAALSQLLDGGARPEAVFCANDLLACGALVEARSRGLRIPKDLALIGFGDNKLMQEVPPGITTVAINPSEIGRLAGEMIAARLAGKKPQTSRHVLPLTLINRGSC